MPAFDLTIQPSLFAFLLGFVVLLAIFEQAVGRVVMSEMLFRL